MWEMIGRILASQHPWSAVFYLVVGALFGALLSIYLTFKAQRPRLIISGGGGGGNQNGQRWSISVMNRPMFLGLPFAGEAARDVQAWIRLREKDAQHYQVFWSDQEQQLPVTIEPGQSQALEVFRWTAGTKGYCIVDYANEPVARFEARELRFVLRLNDRLGRSTEYPLIVKFDDSHLKNTPQLRIVEPASIEARYRMAKNGLRQFLWAFKLKPYQ